MSPAPSEDRVAVTVKCANWHLRVDTVSTLCSTKDSNRSLNFAGTARTRFPQPAASAGAARGLSVRCVGKVFRVQVVTLIPWIQKERERSLSLSCSSLRLNHRGASSCCLAARRSMGQNSPGCACVWCGNGTDGLSSALKAS